MAAALVDDSVDDDDNADGATATVPLVGAVVGVTLSGIGVDVAGAKVPLVSLSVSLSLPLS